MKILIVVFFCLFFISSEAVGSQMIELTVSCPASDVGNAVLSFSASSVPLNASQITIVSNLETRQTLLSSTVHQALLKSMCDANSSSVHVSLFSDYNGNISFSGVWSESEDIKLSELYLKMYVFAFGVVLALAFIGGMKSHG